jgi:putative DNA primase/helicase
MQRSTVSGRVLQERLKMLGPTSADMLILSAEQFLLQQQTMFDLATLEGRAALDEIIEAQKPDLLVLDSVSTLVRTGFENEAESWAPIQPGLMQHRWQGRSVILIQHEGRTSGRPRGTTKHVGADPTNLRYVGPTASFSSAGAGGEACRAAGTVAVPC